MRPSARPIAAVLAAAALVLTAGCGSDSVTIPTGDGKVKVDKDGGTYEVETDDGSFVAGTDLPDGFPEDVPLIEGKVLSGSALDSADGQGFTVALEAEGASAEVADTVKAAFADAGYKTVSQSTAGGAAILGFESTTWTVVVGVNPGEPTTVSYTVAPSADQP